MFVIVDRDRTITNMAHKSVLSVLLLASLAFSAAKGQGKVLFAFYLLQ